MPVRSILAWPPPRLAQALQAEGLRPQQAKLAVGQMGHALWRDQVAWPDALARIGKRAREALLRVALPPPELAIARQQQAADGSVKLLVQLPDGERVESVIIVANHSQHAEPGRRVTLCVSSQVGCGRRCVFCETGRMGLRRNLDAGEIAGQLLAANRLWHGQRGQLPPISNVVFMGMGEPLDNLPAVADAVAVMTDDAGAGLSWRKITVSTVGVAWKLPEFFASVSANLAVSLNAPDDARRQAWMPINARCDLAALKAALIAHLPAGRAVLVEYIVFAGQNDSLADAELLAKWLDGLPARVNLIPANPGPDRHLSTPTDDAVAAMQRHLRNGGVRAMVRHPHGRDIGGACGQLAAAG